MNEQLAINLERTLGISREQVIREEYEIIILKKLFESPLGRAFVFKGGTALRLAYGSPRFSDDLDFSVIEKFKKREADALMVSIGNEFPSLKLVETKQKRFTYFALFRIKEDFLPQSFSLKFEASIRPVDWVKENDFSLLALGSQVTTLTVLAQVANLKKIREEKLAIIPPRVRDIFDLWFIGQRLNEAVSMNFSGFDARVVRRELHKLLPGKERRVLEKWLPEK